MLSVAFQISELFFGDKKDIITIKNLDHLFLVITVVNQEGRYLNKIFKSLNQENYEQYKSQINQHINSIQYKLTNIIDFDKQGRSINLKELLDAISGVLTENSQARTSATDYLFIKSLIFGGDKEILTLSELESVLNRTPQIIDKSLSTVFSFKKGFESDEKMFNFFLVNVQYFIQQLWQHQDQTTILEYNNMLRLMQQFMDDSLNLTQIEAVAESILKLKLKIFEDAGADIHFKSIHSALAYAEDFLAQQYFSEIAFRNYAKRLGSKQEIKYITFQDGPDYSMFTKKQKNKYWAEFKYTTLHYRYFVNDNGYSLYTSEYNRSAKGYTLISMIRYGISIFMKHYGDHSGEKIVFGEQELDAVMQEAKGILKEFIYWPEDYQGFITETITNSDLFQFNSDGSTTATLDELTEYLVSVLHSFKVKDEIALKLEDHCPTIIKSNAIKSFDVQCYRDNIINVFFKELNLKSYFPRLFDYNDSVDDKEMSIYLKNIEAYARLVNDDQVPIDTDELLRVVVIISSIEAIYIKYDKNQDNILTYNELDNAYGLFKGLVIRNVAFQVFEHTIPISVVAFAVVSLVG